MELYLIRHGKTQGNSEGRYVGRTDESLLEEFKGDYKDTYWSTLSPEMIFVSPLKRCVETAEILFPEKSADFIIEENLVETDFGQFEYKNYEELNGHPAYQAWIDSGGMLAFPDGESGSDFRNRSCDAFLACVQKAKEAAVSSAAIVTHGGVIMSIMERFAIPKEDFYHWQVKNVCGFVLEEVNGAFHLKKTVSIS